MAPVLLVSVFASALFRNVTQAAILSTAASLLLICPPLMPDSSMKFLRYDLAQTAITEFVVSGFTSSIIAAVPILCGVIVVTSAAAIAGVVVVQRDVSVGKM